MQYRKDYVVKLKPSRRCAYPYRTKASPIRTWGNHKTGGPGEASLQLHFLDYNSTFSLDRLSPGTSSKKVRMFFVAVPLVSGWDDKTK